MTGKDAQQFVDNWLEANKGDIDDFIDPFIESAQEAGVPQEAIRLSTELFTASITRVMLPLV